MKLFKKIKNKFKNIWSYAVHKYMTKNRELGLTYRALSEYALKCSLLCLGLFLIIILVIILGIFVF